MTTEGVSPYKCGWIVHYWHFGRLWQDGPFTSAVAAHEAFSIRLDERSRDCRGAIDVSPEETTRTRPT